MSVGNPELFLKAINFVLEHPEYHDQHAWMVWEGAINLSEATPILARPLRDPWQGEPIRERVLASTIEPSCGTAGCLAGWVVSLNKELVVIQRDYEDGDVEGEGDYELDLLWVVEPETNKMITISNRAKDLLGIDAYEASVLFDPENSRGALRRMALDLLNDGELKDGSSDEDEPYRDYDERERENEDPSISYRPITLDTETGEYK